MYLLKYIFCMISCILHILIISWKFRYMCNHINAQECNNYSWSCTLKFAYYTASHRHAFDINIHVFFELSWDKNPWRLNIFILVLSMCGCKYIYVFDEYIVANIVVSSKSKSIKLSASYYYTCSSIASYSSSSESRLELSSPQC